MRSSSYMSSGFTMVELVMVIVVLGIVSSIGASIIANVYESYIVQRAQYRANIKTELALNQIANRLRYAIPGTVFAEDGGTMKPITDIDSNSSSRLQWIGYDGDSFEAINCVSSTASCRRPGWSGFMDIDAYTPGRKTLPTPGSNLALASTIIGNLDGTIGDAKIFFPDGTSYGVAGGSGENITLDSAIPSGASIYEQYKLAWSSYAISIEGGDLYLYYDFTPDAGVALGTAKSLLLKNVSNFRFKGSEGALRIKICKEEQIGADSNHSVTIHACKEKVVF